MIRIARESTRRLSLYLQLSEDLFAEAPEVILGGARRVFFMGGVSGLLEESIVGPGFWLRVTAEPTAFRGAAGGRCRRGCVVVIAQHGLVQCPEAGVIP